MVASISALASRDRLTKRGREIVDICLPRFNDDSVWPDINHLRLERKDNFLNSVLMGELTARAERGDDLLRGILAFCQLIAARYDVAPPSFALTND